MSQFILVITQEVEYIFQPILSSAVRKSSTSNALNPVHFLSSLCLNDGYSHTITTPSFLESFSAFGF